MTDHVWVEVKIGDQEAALGKEHLGYKDGMFITMIDPEDNNYGKGWRPSSGASTVFGWLKVNRSDKEYYLDAMERPGEGKEFRASKKILKMDTVKDDVVRSWRKKENSGYLDVSGENVLWCLGEVSIDLGERSNKFKDKVESSEKLNPKVMDINAISAGTTNVGAGEIYVNFQSLVADLANLTSNLYAYLTSHTTEANTYTISIDQSIYTLMFSSSVLHFSDPTKGYTVSHSHAVSNGLDYQGTGASGCQFIVNGYTIKRTGATGNDVMLQSADSDVVCIIRNMIFNGNGKQGTRAIWPTTAQPTTYVYNVKLFDYVQGMNITDANNFCMFGNIVFYDCGTAVWANGVLKNFYNCSFLDNTVTISHPATIVGINCAWDGVGAMGTSAEVGTVDEITSADFLSIDPTNASFLNIDSTSAMYRTGADSLIAVHNEGMNGVWWLTGYWDIGPYSVVDDGGVTGAYGTNFDYGESEYKDEGDVGRAVERETLCLRLATEPSEGEGWSIYNGDDWIRPKANWGRVEFVDSSDIIRNVVFDETDLIPYEEGSYDRRDLIKPSGVDKEDVEDAEIAWEKWGREEVASATDENLYQEHSESHLFIRPQYPDDRGATGYDANGYRTGLEIDLEAYLDGEKTTPKAITEDIPKDGDVVFVGHKLEARRIQQVYKGNAGEVIITGKTDEYIVKGKPGSRTNRTMTERTLQSTLMGNKAVHLSRGIDALLNRVTGSSLTGTATQTTGPDGKSSSAFTTAANLDLSNSAITGYTAIVWLSSFAADAIDGLTLTEYSQDTDSGFSLAYATGAGAIAANLELKTGYTWFDVRLYSAEIANLTTDILPYIYRDVLQNTGKAILPIG